MENDKKTREYENKKNKYEWERVWTYHSEADNLFHRRFNFFIVAESMLIISFATLFSNKQANHVKIAISVLGLIYTFGWYVVNVRLDKKMEFLKQNFLEPKDRFYEAYMKCVKDIRRWDIFNDEIFPIAIFLFWEFLLFQLFIPMEPIGILIVILGLYATGFLINGIAHWLIPNIYEDVLQNLSLK